LKLSSETSAKRMITLHGPKDNAVKLERPIGLAVGCALPTQAAAKTAFEDFSNHSHIILARNYHLTVTIGMAQKFQEVQ
jgi:hypothetical protein